MAKRVGRSGLFATIVRIEHQWFAALPTPTTPELLAVNETDAWNWDVERGLTVRILRRPHGCCRIVGRSQNKCFRTIVVPSAR